jgi:hypothetical protein
MGPSLETFLTVLFPIVVVIGGAAFIFREQFKRLGRFIVDWQRRDEQLDLEEVRLREKAEAELAESQGLIHRLDPDDNEVNHERH